MASNPFQFIDLPKYQPSPLMDLAPINQGLQFIAKQRQIGEENRRADEMLRMKQERQPVELDQMRAQTTASEGSERRAAELFPLQKEQTRASTEAQRAQTTASEAADRRAGELHSGALTKQTLEIGAQARDFISPPGQVTVIPDNGSAVITDRRTGEYRTIDPSGENAAKAKFDREYAKKAPEYFRTAQEGYTSATQASQTAKDMELLLPHIYSGTWAGAQTEVAKFLNSRFGTNWQGVAPTELFGSLAQQFVGQEGQKYKPLSNSDITFIERGLPNIQKDRDSEIVRAHVLNSSHVSESRMPSSA